MTGALLVCLFAATTAAATLLWIALCLRAELATVTRQRDEAQATADFLTDQHAQAAMREASYQPLLASLRQRGMRGRAN